MRTLETVIGFDVREMWLPFADTWTDERRELCCLRKDVERVLSTDQLVWPSVFEADGQLPRPDEPTGWLQDLWDSCDSLLDYLGGTWAGHPKPCRLIAVTVLLEFCDKAQRRYWQSRAAGAAPRTLGPEWSLLGYDVSDDFLLSGLSNCGYSPETEDVEGLRRTWSPRLNGYHLFPDAHNAAEFARLSDSRVSEHAPFFVFGLWHNPTLPAGAGDGS